MSSLRWIIVTLGLAIAVGCDAGPKSGKGFTLPDGEVEQGLAVFTKLRCHDCHSVSGIELPPGEQSDEKPIHLGGKVTRIKTYGELVTSIINPSHRLAPGYATEQISSAEGESRMRNYNEVMTVDELIHLVAFLQSKYQIYVPPPTDYAPYF